LSFVSSICRNYASNFCVICKNKEIFKPLFDYSNNRWLMIRHKMKVRRFKDGDYD
jgi:hypothetical protein